MNLKLGLVFSLFFAIGCESFDNAYDGGFDLDVLPESTSVCVYDEDTETYSGDLVITDRGRVSGETYFAQGGLCIFDSIENIWDRSMLEDFMVWRGAESGRVTSSNSNPEAFGENDFVFSFKARHERVIDWDIEYFHFLLAGNLEYPEEVKIDFQLTRSSAAQFFSNQNGVISIKKLDEGVTSVSIYTEINAHQKDDAEAVSSINEIVDKLQNLELL